MTLDYSHEKGFLGTSGALRKCLSLVYCEPVLVINGDSYCQVNVSDYFQWHAVMTREGSLVVVKAETPSDLVRRNG